MKITFRTLSPDGFDTVCGATYPSRARARQAARDFASAFVMQGHFRTGNGDLIPVELIASKCKIEPAGKIYKRPAHLWDFEGNLFSTRTPRPYAVPLRRNYIGHVERIETGAQLRATLRAGPFAWPGGYPLFFMTADGAALSFETVLDEYPRIISAIRDRDTRGGWRVIGCAVNWEDQELIDAHTDQKIACAYSE